MKRDFLCERQWRETAVDVEANTWILIVLGHSEQDVARSQWRIQLELMHCVVIARRSLELL